MPWYFLPAEHVGENAVAILEQQGVISTENETLTPVATKGIAFYAEVEQLPELLIAIGLGGFDSAEEASDQENVLFLKLKAKRKRTKVRVAAKKIQTGADALIAKYGEAASAAREAVAKTIAEDRAVADRLTIELTKTLRKIHDAEMQMAFLGEVTTTVADGLRHEYDAIRANPFVSNVGVEGDALIITTSELVLSRRAILGDTNPVKRHRIGQLIIILGMCDGTIEVRATTPLGPSAHPIVSALGMPYLGSVRDSVVRFIARREFGNAAKILLSLLAATPRDPTAEEYLGKWPIVE